jgi:hypothetical protein
MLAFTLANSSSFVDVLLAMRFLRFSHLVNSSWVQFSGSAIFVSAIRVAFYIQIRSRKIWKLTASRIRLLRKDFATKDAPCCRSGNESGKGKEEVLFGVIACQ